MKTHQSVSSQRRKSRKAYFTAPSSVRRVMMSCRLAKDLVDKYNVRSLPVRKGDQVKIMVGHKKETEGKVQSVYPSNCIITALKLDKCRKATLENKDRKVSHDK